MTVLTLTLMIAISALVVGTIAFTKIKDDDNGDNDDFVGATHSVNGVRGLVPQPVAGDQNKFLQGNGNWAVVPETSPGGGGEFVLKYTVGPDETDEFTTVQEAIDAAVAAGVTGANPASIWVKAGMYTAGFTLVDGITVRGSGAQATTVSDVITSSTGFCALESLTANNIMFSGGSGIIVTREIGFSGAFASTGAGFSWIAQECTLTTPGTTVNFSHTGDIFWFDVVDLGANAVLNITPPTLGTLSFVGCIIGAFAVIANTGSAPGSSFQARGCTINGPLSITGTANGGETVIVIQQNNMFSGMTVGCGNGIYVGNVITGAFVLDNVTAPGASQAILCNTANNFIAGGTTLNVANGASFGTIMNNYFGGAGTVNGANNVLIFSNNFMQLGLANTSSVISSTTNARFGAAALTGPGAIVPATIN
jgi:hypothetical protein